MVRRLCRRSELRAARWLEADAVVQQSGVGFSGTTCLQMDDSKVRKRTGNTSHSSCEDECVVGGAFI